MATTRILIANIYFRNQYLWDPRQSKNKTGADNDLDVMFRLVLAYFYGKFMESIRKSEGTH